MIILALKAIIDADTGMEGEFAERVYPTTAPDEPTYPFLVLTKAAGVGEYDLKGDANVERARVQIDVHTDLGAAECIRLKTIVRRFFSGFSGGAPGFPCQIQSMFCINDFDLTEPATERAGPRVRRRTLEFTVWHKEI